MHPSGLILITLFGVSARGIFKLDEIEVTLSGLLTLRIRQCIFICQTINGSALKKLSRELILTATMREEVLEAFLSRAKPPDVSTAIVTKTQSPALFVDNYSRMHWFTWFLIADELDERIRIPFNCQFLHVRREPDGSFRLVENYHIKQSPTFGNDFGIWTPENGLNATPLNFYRRRTDMKGVELVRTDRTVHKCGTYKLEYEIQRLWVESAKRLNFTLRLVDDTLNTTSKTNRPDVCTCIWAITGLDFNKDWVFLNFGVSVRLLTKFRSSNEIGWKAYVKPFKSEMWAVVGLWLLLSTVAIVIVNGRTTLSLHDNLFTGFYFLCSSDATATHPPKEPTPLSTRLVYLMTLMVPTVIIPAYSAYILSTLSIAFPLEPFHDLKSLIEDGTFKVSAVNNTFVIRYFKGSEDPEIKYVYDHLFVGVDHVEPSFGHLFERICQDPNLAGLFLDTKNFRSLFKCRMFVIEQAVFSISTGFLLQKQSPLRKLFNELFAMYDEKGVMYRPAVIRQNTPSHVAKFEPDGRLNSLNVSQMSALFLLIPMGVLLSGVILAIEIAVERKFRVRS